MGGNPVAAPLCRNRILAAAALKARHPERNLSYADAIGYATAQELDAILHTSDRGLAGLPGVRVVAF